MPAERTTTPTDAVSDEHWDEIDRRLDGGLVDDRILRIAQRRRWPWIAGLVVLCAGGLTAGWFFDDALPAATPDVPDSVVSSVLAPVLMVIAFGLWATGILVLVRTRGLVLPAQEPTTGMPKRVRRQIARAITGRGWADPAHLRSLRRLAVLRLDQGTWASWFVGGLAPMALAQAVLAWGQGRAAVYVVAVAFFVVAVMTALHRRRGWRAFLATHPRDGGEPAPGS